MSKQINREQADAIRHLSGPCLVIAPPGSGKTFTLTKRVQYLLQNGIPPERILVITFTRAAAAEMKTRFLKLAKERETAVTFGTFHAVYLDILKKSFHFTMQDILTKQEKRRIFLHLADACGIPEEELPDEERFFDEISRMKNAGQAPDQYHPLALDGDFYREMAVRYLAACRNAGKLDFDDMVLRCKEELSTHPRILALWQKRYSHILVDEFQDINLIQYQVLQMLAFPENNLFLVGDDDQSIYGFRGSKPQLMQMLKNDYPQLSQIMLKVNYRSGSRILNAAGKLIEHNRLRFPKEVISGRTNAGKVKIHICTSAEEQKEAVVRFVKEAGPDSGVALLARTRSALADYAALFSMHEIPFWMDEPVKSLYEHPAALDLCAYLALADGVGTREDFLRVIRRPKRMISYKSVLPEDFPYGWMEKLRQESRSGNRFYGEDESERFLLDFKRISEMPPYAAVHYIRGRMGYEQDILSGRQMPGGKEQALKALMLVQESTRGIASHSVWKHRFEKQAFLCRQAILHSADQADGNKEDERKEKAKKAGVRLMTMHGAKGLEFDHVLIPDLNERILPHKKAFLPEELEEERRLFYVAITRAAERLFLSCICEDGNKKSEISRFLREISDRSFAG